MMRGSCLQVDETPIKYLDPGNAPGLCKAFGVTLTGHTRRGFFEACDPAPKEAAKLDRELCAGI
jgi:hypothetical protein